MKRTLFLVLALLVTLSCEKESYKKGSPYPAAFSCDTNVSPYNLIKTPGLFLTVRLNLSKGVLNISDSNGQSYPPEALTDIQSRQFTLGLAGLILGIPSLSDNGQICAFDLGCPECEQSSVRLKIDQTGNATCSKCNRTWSLNNNGIAISGKARPLYSYHVSYNNGILTVLN